MRRKRNDEQGWLTKLAADDADDADQIGVDPRNPWRNVLAKRKMTVDEKDLPRITRIDTDRKKTFKVGFDLRHLRDLRPSTFTDPGCGLTAT